MATSSDERETFAMVRQRDLDDALELVQTRQLQLRDIAVLMAVVASLNWRTGRAQITSRSIAERLGIQRADCKASLARLRKQELVVWVVDRHTGESYYLINPALAAVGTQRQRGHLCQQFMKALEGPS